MNPKQLGQRLAKFRTDAGLTQRSLAIRADVTVVTISELERGLNDNPELKTLLGIARALQRPVVDLVPELLAVPEVEPEREAVNG